MFDLWWGYKHVNGSYQVKIFFSKLDIDEARESPFCDIAIGPFSANSREEALKIVEERTK